MNDPHELKSKAQMIQAVSPSFCLAKWLQVTVDLVHGTTQSCHHPPRHKVPLEELRTNISALHNTNQKKLQRKEMLEGRRPQECSYCWHLEDSGVHWSDRMIKSTDPWAFAQLEKVKAAPWDADWAPTYLEVMLDNTCDFSCAYCMADISSSIYAEIQKFGPYQVNKTYAHVQFRASQNERAIYEKAFWLWLPKILSELHVFRLTGGEPLLAKAFWQTLKLLANQKNSQLTLAINSHFSHPAALISKLTEALARISANGSVRDIEIYVSLDTSGLQAEYIRFGLNYQLVLQNIRKATRAFPKLKFVIMCTFNLLAFDQFHELIQDIIELKESGVSASIDISCLREPQYLRADLADQEMKAKWKLVLMKMESHDLFTEHERAKARAADAFIHRQNPADFLSQHRGDFYRFVMEYDQRKSLDFRKTFPGYQNFLNRCYKEALVETGSFHRNGPNCGTV